MTAISILYSVDARFALTTVARAGVSPGTTHDCQTPFISAKVAISVSQMVADNKRLLSVFASLSSASIVARISRVWIATLAPPATCPRGKQSCCV